MSLRLYNTLHRELEDFQPLHSRQTGLYSCGPTVYAPQHIGNMRYFIFVDTLKRTLSFDGYSVKHVMNITDVGHLTSDQDTGDDKMEASARRQRLSAREIADTITARFMHDLAWLNIITPDVIPYATKTIDLQIDLITKLENQGVTYKTTDGIYFNTGKFPHYGQLSGQKSADKKSGARVEENMEKKNPTDFALWKFSKPEDQRQMEWPSPWGTGFPGWHIECSAMSMQELGEQFDIHTGGVDHIAVHHENEIAQSEAATGKHPFVKYWLHGEFLVLPDKRMGKSEGNSITLQDVVQLSVPALAFRYMCLLTHYRKQLSYTPESLTAAATALKRIWLFLEDKTLDRSVKPHGTYIELFTAAINDDLNTPAALGALHDLLNDNTVTVEEQVATLSIFDTVLALDLTPEAAQKQLTPTGPGLEAMLAEYEVARQEKRFVDSDTIRQRFEEMGVVVEDTPDGSRLRKK